MYLSTPDAPYSLEIISNPQSLLSLSSQLPSRYLHVESTEQVTSRLKNNHINEQRCFKAEQVSAFDQVFDTLSTTEGTTKCTSAPESLVLSRRFNFYSF